MDTTLLVTTYAAYTLVAVPLVVWLARTLTGHGAVFLRDVFDDTDLADAVNRLLAIGFLLVNLGYALLLVTTGGTVTSGVDAVEILVTKLGTLLLSLGVLHLVNMLVLWRIRRRGTESALLRRTDAPMAPPTAPA